MGITDELRRFIEDPLLGYASQDQHIEKLTEIADRIDVAHKHAIGYVDDRDPDTMAEHGWVRMPEDADGEYWFCGDKIVLPDGNVVEIIGIGGDWLYYCVESVATTVFGRIRAHDKHHYHAPTVEDLLFSYGQACIRTSNEAETDAAKQTMLARLREDYAAKLRLADYGKEQ